MFSAALLMVQRNAGRRWPAIAGLWKPCHSDRREESPRCAMSFDA